MEESWQKSCSFSWRTKWKLGLCVCLPVKQNKLYYLISQLCYSLQARRSRLRYRVLLGNSKSGCRDYNRFENWAFKEGKKTTHRESWRCDYLSGNCCSKSWCSRSTVQLFCSNSQVSRFINRLLSATSLQQLVWWLSRRIFGVLWRCLFKLEKSSRSFSMGKANTRFRRNWWQKAPHWIASINISRRSCLLRAACHNNSI